VRSADVGRSPRRAPRVPHRTLTAPCRDGRSGPALDGGGVPRRCLSGRSARLVAPADTARQRLLLVMERPSAGGPLCNRREVRRAVGLHTARRWLPFQSGETATRVQGILEGAATRVRALAVQLAWRGMR
jgi:hypothetical protein